MYPKNFVIHISYEGFICVLHKPYHGMYSKGVKSFCENKMETKQNVVIFSLVMDEY